MVLAVDVDCSLDLDGGRAGLLRHLDDGRGGRRWLVFRGVGVAQGRRVGWGAILEGELLGARGLDIGEVAAREGGEEDAGEVAAEEGFRGGDGDADL